MILQDLALAAMDPAMPALLGPEAGWVIGIRGDRIAYVGPQRDAPAELYDEPPVSLEGRLVTPALIDCHTHLVHGGHRAGEWESRLAGASYEEVARAGGGILSSVRATRAASAEGLFDAALPRLDALLADGTGTVEIKSGYGLDRETELAMLRAARRLGQEREATIVTTFLGAHAVPPPYRGMSGGARRYLEEVAIPALRAAHAEGLVDAVDAFCEGIAFTPDEVALLFDEAARLKLPVRLHAEQLSHSGGARLAAARGGSLGRPSRIRDRGGRPRDGPRRDRGRPVARRLLCPEGDEDAPPSRPSARRVCAWPWRPMPIPAARRCCRSGWR
ncbi:Imidazolonepropionase [Rubellimicrobium thermophilum DSM 16684]|uniref:imidazolonepropionase n=1 Tax=Rubellimicrobium thermophilum DSM 16684 TaxID=1123069 RepID=S9R337_9RHOB|nr:Imidazolonepropionase [Rubellimicrobium thermophilum DSM 16684]